MIELTNLQFYKEKRFKETPIGKIPEDWEVVKLKDVVKKSKFAIVDGPFGTQLHRDEYRDKGIPLIRVNNINRDGSFNYNDLVYIDEEKFEKLKRSAVYPGDILLAKTGATIGKVCLFPKMFEKGLIASSCAKISIDEKKAEIFYVFYFLLSDYGYKQILNLATGSTRPTINLEPISRIKIILPKRLKEQKAIAHVLSTVDKAIQKTNEIIEKIERLKKGLMQELLTKGIGHKEFKDTEIGRIPKEWEIVKLENILELCQYGLSIKMKNKGRYPIIRMDEIENGYVIPKITKRVDLDEKTFRTFKLEKGDILFNRTNSYELVGRTGIFLLDGDYVFASYLIRLRVKRNLVDPHFLTFYLIFSHNRLKQLATKAVHQANINATNLKKFKIPLPSLSEQEKIVEILSIIDKRLEVEKRRKEKLERIKKALMDLLLTGKIRIKIVEG